MRARDFKECYRMVDAVNEKTGRPEKRAVYIGDYYRFPEGSPLPRQRALTLAPFVAAYMLLGLAYLLTARATATTLYALFPQLLGLVPGFYALMGLWKLYTAPQPMTEIRRAFGPARLWRSCLACGVLSLIACAGAAVLLSLRGLWGEGWYEALLPGLAAAAAFPAFLRARAQYQSMEKAEKARKEEDPDLT